MRVPLLRLERVEGLEDSLRLNLGELEAVHDEEPPLLAELGERARQRLRADPTRGPKNTGRMKGADYLNFFVLPNFHFHLATAYGILRHSGVEIGKLDFLGAIPISVT